MRKLLTMLLLSTCALTGLSAHAGMVDDAVKRGTLRVGMDPTYMGSPQKTENKAR
ncbi:polar amino acid transport system substrate-binding protein [Pseudomonas indica]|jgi:polar amino acid transport system substrate-binding protein|uniref:Polar amino acid transport system substrate-binding protein n=1 Tax=Pseudomonas indica TaxID=137658 RepID=A0A1G8TUR9_9PSED|nr:polar amino acid transport system substrate-binding protein [Pseudomonas indica]